MPNIGTVRVDALCMHAGASVTLDPSETPCRAPRERTNSWCRPRRTAPNGPSVALARRALHDPCWKGCANQNHAGEDRQPPNLPINCVEGQLKDFNSAEANIGGNLEFTMRDRLAAFRLAYHSKLFLSSTVDEGDHCGRWGWCACCCEQGTLCGDRAALATGCHSRPLVCSAPLA